MFPSLVQITPGTVVKYLPTSLAYFPRISSFAESWLSCLWPTWIFPTSKVRQEKRTFLNILSISYLVSLPTLIALDFHELIIRFYSSKLFIFFAVVFSLLFYKLGWIFSLFVISRRVGEANVLSVSKSSIFCKRFVT